ncbi:MAG: DUF177 domain-containing protein [Flavobacteriales bacterium]|nr:DUF177 domain-containing protein [Flavobacteriales bacterium]MBK9286784.1 DUF177 domain-containing protein [Flavobacteriales bacterium]MBL0035271.1 DUF177 domain-containing protein [Flavobacteriales bacterium]
MDAFPEHTIAFTGLKDGEHRFTYELDNAFFVATEQEDYVGGKVHVDVTMDKSQHMLVCKIHVDGTVQVHCDHCNALMDFPVKGDQRQIFTLTGDENEEGDEELVPLDAQAHEVNLTHYFFECITLHMPARRVHPQGQCDPEVDQALSQFTVEHEPEPDPRWEALKALKNDPSDLSIP